MSDGALKARRLAADTRMLVAAHDLLAFRDRAPRRLVGPDGATGVFDPGAARLVVDDGASLRAATVAGAGISTNALWSVAGDLAAGRLVRVLPGWSV